MQIGTKSMQTLEQDSSTLVTLTPLGAEHRTQSGSWIHVMLDLEASHQVFTTYHQRQS